MADSSERASRPPASSSGEVDPRLLEVLVCPVTHGVLELGDPAAPTDGTRPTSRCRSCEHAWTTSGRSA